MVRMTRLARIVQTALVALLLAATLASPARALASALARTLERLERDIGGAAGLVQILREQVETAELAEADATSAAGIADGGYISTLRALRAASRRLDRRLDELDDRLPEADDPDADAILLAMRLELASLELAFEDVLAAADAGGRREALARIDAALISLDGGTAAVWTLDGVRAASDAGDRFYWAAHGNEISEPAPPVAGRHR